MKYIEKAVFSILIVFVLLLTFQKTASAQAPKWWNQDLNSFEKKVNGADGTPDNEIFGERYTFAQVNWIINSLAILQAGKLAECFGNPGVNTSTCVKQVQQLPMSSPIFFLASLNDSILSNRPASGINYIANKIQQYSPIQTAYAQQNSGFGFGTLQPLQKLWIAFRNVSFGLMAFVLIILAFMIMLRQKISPQAVITAQSALPKVVIALIFITFSYAIAGLLVDFAYVIMGLAAAILAQSGLLKAAAPNVIDIFNKMNNPISAFTGWTLILGGFIFAAGAGTVLATIATGGLATIAGAVSGLIGVILLVLAFVAIFRIFITMLKAFTTIVFLIIGAPIIGLGSIVSVGPGIGGWVRQMAAQLAVFVGICLTMLLAHMLFWTMTVDVNGWLGDIITGGANYYGFSTGAVNGGAILLPGFGGFPIQILAFFIGFGVLFSAPKIAKGLSDQIATGRGSYGFDSGGTMLGAGIPFIGGMAMGQLGRLQTGLGNAATKIALTQGPNAVRAITGRGSGQPIPPDPVKTAGSGDTKAQRFKGE